MYAVKEEPKELEKGTAPVTAEQENVQGDQDKENQEDNGQDQ